MLKQHVSPWKVLSLLEAKGLQASQVPPLSLYAAVPRQPLGQRAEVVALDVLVAF